MGQKNKVFSVMTKTLPKLGERHKFKDSRGMVNSKDKYIENLTYKYYSQTTKKQR